MSVASRPVDLFTALAEPRRRRIVELLAQTASRSVNEIVDSMRLPQPAVSKHLAVLRGAGIVSVERRGRERHYRLVAQSLKPVHDWVSEIERFWRAQLDGIKARAERRARRPTT